MSHVLASGVFGLKADIGRFMPHMVISIGEKDEEASARAGLDSYRGPVLRLEFADLDRIYPGISYHAPSKSHFEALDAFLAQHANAQSRVLVHCHAGISRSPATAIYVQLRIAKTLMQLTLDDALIERIIDDVFTTAPSAMPNKRILKIIAREFPEVRGLLDAKVESCVQAYKSADITSLF